MPDKKAMPKTQIPMTGHDNDDASDAERERDAGDGEDIDITPDAWEQGNSGTPVDADEWVQVTQLKYDRKREGELATALVKAIAEAKGVDPLDHAQMPPLYESIDAHALEETFFGPSGADTHREETGTITFHYNGYTIALRSDGWIFVYEPT
jgi:hypothetical protein